MISGDAPLWPCLCLFRGGWTTPSGLCFASSAARLGGVTLRGGVLQSRELPKEMFQDKTIVSLFPTHVWVHDLAPDHFQPMNRSLSAAIEELISPRPQLGPGEIWQTDQNLHKLPALRALDGLRANGGRGRAELLEDPLRGLSSHRQLGQHRPAGHRPSGPQPPQQLPERRLLREGGARRRQHHLQRSPHPDRHHGTARDSGGPGQRRTGPPAGQGRPHAALSPPGSCTRSTSTAAARSASPSPSTSCSRISRKRWPTRSGARASRKGARRA